MKMGPRTRGRLSSFAVLLSVSFFFYFPFPYLDKPPCSGLSSQSGCNDDSDKNSDKNSDVE